MNRRSLIIDLTALLDVIMILLFMVLIASRQQMVAEGEQRKGQVAALQTELSVREVELRQRASENTALQRQIAELELLQMPQTDSEKRWYAAYQSQIGKLDLIYPVDYHIHALQLRDGGGNLISKPQTAAFSEWLEDALQDMPQQVVILTFSYHNDSIYWRDYQNTRNEISAIARRSSKQIIYSEVEAGS